MGYLEVMESALKGRSVNSTAKQWGLTQAELQRFVKGQRLPGFRLALRIADEAGISRGEMLEALALEEEKLKSKVVYNSDRADVAQLVEQLIRNQ